MRLLSFAFLCFDGRVVVAVVAGWLPCGWAVCWVCRVVVHGNSTMRRSKISLILHILHHSP